MARAKKKTLKQIEWLGWSKFRFSGSRSGEIENSDLVAGLGGNSDLVARAAENISNYVSMARVNSDLVAGLEGIQI